MSFLSIVFLICLFFGSLFFVCLIRFRYHVALDVVIFLCNCREGVDGRLVHGGLVQGPFASLFVPKPCELALH